MSRSDFGSTTAFAEVMKGDLSILEPAFGLKLMQFTF